VNVGLHHSGHPKSEVLVDDEGHANEACVNVKLLDELDELGQPSGRQLVTIDSPCRNYLPRCYTVAVEGGGSGGPGLGGSSRMPAEAVSVGPGSLPAHGRLRTGVREG
jgi:hypothetical protein